MCKRPRLANALPGPGPHKLPATGVTGDRGGGIVKSHVVYVGKAPVRSRAA
jgi:hypothetical protein